MRKETKRFLWFLLFLVVLCGLSAWAGYTISESHHERQISVLNTQVNELICERDSLLDVYTAGDKILQRTLDSLRVVNADRKMWKNRYYEKIREPLPTSSTELEDHIYELIKLIKGEILPD